MADDNDKTIRLDDNEDDKTVRFDSGDTISADPDDDKTIRIDAESDKTTRIDNDIISADGNGNDADDDKTTRFDEEIISADGGSSGGSDDAGKIKSQMPKGKKTPQKEEKKEYKGIEKFLLNNGEYENIKILSTESGEASIYLVEKDSERSVLKLYYRDIKPKILLLDKIKSLDTNSIIKVHDFGKTQIGGEIRYYELMEFAEGGTLDNSLPIRDAKKIKTIIRKTADALNTLHTNGIIHKDIKPSNIFQRKKGGDDYILGDFGISSMFDDAEQRVITKQNRTETFAPPELYLSAKDHDVEITPSVDWYALGISVLFMWLGHDPFKDISIVQIPSAKMKCRLDFPDDMPEDIKNFVKGCSVPLYEDRWGYNEINRWLNGENVPVNLQSAMSLDYKPFVFDPAKQLEAATPEELAKLMMKDPDLAKKYLYRGKITKWLEESNNTKLAVSLEYIYEKEFPEDEDTGLKAAIYLLDESMAFKGIDGKECNSDDDFARLFLENFDHYMEALSNPNEDFYIYLRARNLGTKVTEYLAIYEKFSEMYALYNIIYSMDPSMPFRYTEKAKDGNWYVYYAKDAFELGKAFEEHTSGIRDFYFYGYVSLWLENRQDVENVSDDELKRIVELLSWSETIIDEFKEKKDQGIKLATYVFNPDTGFLSQDGKTRLFSKEEVGNEILGYGDHYIRVIDDAESDIRLFMRARLWGDVIDYINFCFTMDNHNGKLGRYNYDIAWMKVVAFMGINISYTLDEKWYNTPEDLNDASASVKKKLKPEIENIDSVFMAWLSVNFHESLETDRDKTEYAYEDKLLEMFEFIVKLNTGAEITKRYEKAKKAVPKKIRKEKAKDRNFMLAKLLAIILPIITGAGLFMYVQSEGVSFFEGQFWSAGFDYYIAFMVIFTVIYAVTGGFGEGWDFSAGCFGAPIIGAILAVITFYVIKFTVTSPYIFGALLLVILGFGLYKIFTATYSDRATRKEIFNMDDKFTFEYEPVAFAMSSDNEYVSQRLQVLDQYNSARKFARKDLLKYGFIPTGIFLGILALFITTDSGSIVKYLDKYNNIGSTIAGFIPSFSSVPEVEGMWDGTLGKTALVMDVTSQDGNSFEANLSVLSKTPKHFSVAGLIDSTYENVTLTDNSGGVYQGAIDEDKMIIAGVYTPKSGRTSDFTMHIREEVKEEAPAEKTSKPVKKETTTPPATNNVTDNKAADNNQVTPDNKKALDLLDQEVKKMQENTATENTQTDNKPAQTKTTPVVPAVSQPEVKEETPAEPEQKPEPPAETKPVHKDAIQSVTDGGYLASVVECRKITSTRMRVTFRFTNMEDARSFMLADKNISLKDDKGNTYTPDIRILGNKQAEANGGELSANVDKNGSIEAGLIFNKIDANASTASKINLRVFASGWKVFEFNNIKIK